MLDAAQLVLSSYTHGTEVGFGDRSAADAGIDDAGIDDGPRTHHVRMNTFRCYRWGRP